MTRGVLLGLREGDITTLSGPYATPEDAMNAAQGDHARTRALLGVPEAALTFTATGDPARPQQADTDGGQYTLYVLGDAATGMRHAHALGDAEEILTRLRAAVMGRALRAVLDNDGSGSQFDAQVLRAARVAARAALRGQLCEAMNVLDAQDALTTWQREPQGVWDDAAYQALTDTLNAALAAAGASHDPR